MFYIFQTAVESELELVRTQLKEKSEQHQSLQVVRRVVEHAVFRNNIFKIEMKQTG